MEYAVLASFVALETFGAVLALGIALQNWLTEIANRIRAAEWP